MSGGGGVGGLIRMFERLMLSGEIWLGDMAMVSMDVDLRMTRLARVRFLVLRNWDVIREQIRTMWPDTLDEVA
jgi:hypothetical protein